MIESIKTKYPYRKKQKLAKGLQDVSVPEAGNNGDVLSSGLNGAAMGATVGGPWGAAAGLVGGVVTGSIKKNQQDEANQQALTLNRKNKANRLVDGYDETVDQKFQVYKTGSKRIKAKKQVEVEHNEHHFDSQLNHKGVYKGATHKEGGIDTTVEEGDSIFPAKQKKTIDKALQKGDKNTIAKLKAKLPKDKTKKKLAFGLNNDPEVPDPIAFNKRDKSLKPVLFGKDPLFANAQNRKGQYGAYDQMVAGFADGSSTWLNKGDKGNPYPYPVGVNSQGTMYRHDTMPAIQPNNLLNSGLDSQVKPIPTTLPTSPVDNSSSISTGTSIGDATNEQNPVGNLAKYANTANNVIRGLQSQPKVEESYLDPNLLNYQDRSESLRQESRSTARIKSSNARNTSGGLISNLRSNQQLAENDNLVTQDQINEREVARADQIANTNVQIKNAAKQVNLGRRDMYQDIRDRNRAVSDSYLDSAASGIADQANVNEQTQYLKSRDHKLDARDDLALKVVNGMTRYQIDKQGNTSFKTNGSGGSITNSIPVTSSTTKVDKEGKVSTSSTTKSGSTKQTSPFGTIKRKSTNKTIRLR